MTFYFIFSLILHCFLLNFLLFLLCKLITPAQVTLWHDTPTLKFSFTFVVMTMYSFNLILDLCRWATASSCSLPLTLSGNVLAQLRPSSSSTHFSQTPHQSPDKFQLLIFFACAPKLRFAGLQLCLALQSSHCHHRFTSLPAVGTALLPAVGTALLPFALFYGFLGSDPGCFSSRRILGFRPWLFFFFFLGHHSNFATLNFCRTRFVTNLDMHCLLSKF